MDPEILCSTNHIGNRSAWTSRVGGPPRSLPQTQLVVTHDLPFALATCARSLVLDEGKIALDLETEALLNDPDLLARHRLRCRSAIAPDVRIRAIDYERRIRRCGETDAGRTIICTHLPPARRSREDFHDARVRRCRCRPVPDRPNAAQPSPSLDSRDGGRTAPDGERLHLACLRPRRA